MKQINKFQNKPKGHSLPLRYTLMASFLVFSIAIVALLCLLQTVFFDTFYKTVKAKQVESTAKSIASMLKNGSSEKNNKKFSEIVSENSDMSILLYDTTDNIYTQIYPSQSGGVGYFGIKSIEDHEVYQYYQKALDNNGVCVTYERGVEYTGKAITDDGSTVEEGEQRYPLGNTLRDGIILDKHEVESVVYAQIVSLSEDEQYFIVIDSVITPVTSTVETIRVQLSIVTWIILGLSAMLAFLLAGIIATPIAKVNRTAKELAKQNYDVEFSGGTYLEIEELNDTLNYTTRELKKNDRLKRELIANVSHDLRTPLTMIIGYGEVVRDLPGENTPENIQIIIDEATRLSTLVSDLMDLSKLQSGAMEIKRSEFSLTEKIKSIFMRYAKLVEQKGFRIEFESDGDARVYADDSKVNQVIYNLVNNAVNYAGEDKTVIVRQKANKKRVTIEIEDHGCGIEEKDIALIWDRYYKVDKEHKSSVIGTGLGLSIVKNILEVHAAEYGVRSKVGRGSVFWFTLPCVSYIPDKRGKTILYLNTEGKFEMKENLQDEDFSIVPLFDDAEIEDD